MGLLTRDKPAPVDATPGDPLNEGPGAPWGKRFAAARDRLAAVEEKRAACALDITAQEAALQQAEDGAGAAAYADEASAEQIAADIGRCRTRVDVARRVLAVADGKVDEAKRDMLRAQADELRPRIATQERDAQAHLSKVDALLSQLEELDGPRYVIPEVPDLQGDTHLSLRPLAWTRSADMEAEVERLKRLLRLLELVVEGNGLPQFWNLSEQVTEYPATLHGPHALAVWPTVTYPGQAPVAPPAAEADQPTGMYAWAKSPGMG